jgi:adenosylhomocysteine nucleosidase
VSVTGIVAALTAEARTLGPSVHGPTLDTLPDGNLLAISGMGPQAAARAAQVLLAAGARHLLSFGLAGALDPQLGAGTVFLAETVLDESGTAHPTCGPWRERLARLAASRGVAGGALLSVAQPLLSADAKAQARHNSGAAAVDMESFAIGAIAVRQGVDFAVARVVVDTASDAVPRSVAAATGARGEVNYVRLIAALLGTPQDLPALLRLSRRYRAAMASLRFLGQQGVGPA